MKTRKRLLIGLLVWPLALPAVAQQEISPEMQALVERYNAMRQETKLALMNAGRMVRNGDLEGAAQLLEQALRKVTPESDDFKRLQLDLIAVWSKQGKHEQCADAFATWIRTTRSVDVVDPFIQWLRLEAQAGQDRLNRLIKEIEEPADAQERRLLARLLVGDLEYRVWRDVEGEVEPLLQRAVEAIRAAEADDSLYCLLRFASLLNQSDAQPNRDIKFRRMVFEVVGEDSLDVSFLMSMAGGEYIRGDRIWTRKVLNIARPRIDEEDANTLGQWLLLSAWQHRNDGQIAEAKAEVEALKAVAPRATRQKYLPEQLRMLEDELSRMGPGTGPATVYRPGAIKPVDPPPPTTTAPAPPDPGRTAPDPRQAEEALRALAADAPDAESIERAARLATVDFGPREGNEDYISRLLLAYREILIRSDAATPKDTVRAIDAKLLWLARDTGRLTNVRHWSRWADAVAALRGVRASRDLKKFVYHEAPVQVSEPAFRKEVERAKQALEQTKEPASLPGATTQPAAASQPAGPAVREPAGSSRRPAGS